MKTSFDDLAFLFRQLAMAAQAGLPLREVFTVLRKESAGSLIALVGKQVQDGASLPSALDSVRALPRETAELVRAGEASALLPALLDALAADYARRAAGRRALLKAIYWPAALAVAMFLLLFVTMVFVMPAFGSAYADFGAELPAITRALVAATDFIALRWPWAALAVVLTVGLVLVLRKRAVPVLPFVNPFRERMFQLRLAAMLAFAATAGAGCVSAALAHLRATAPTRRAARSIDALTERLAAGADLFAAMRDTAYVPHRVAAMLELGARAGSMSAARAHIDSWCAAEFDEAVPRFEADVLIATYVVIGVVLANVVIALYLPIFRLGSVV